MGDHINTLVRKPGAGDRHARFDERDLETGHFGATAPDLDSTAGGQVLPYQGIIEPNPTVVLAVLAKADTTSLGKKRQHNKVPLISIVDDDRSVVEAMVSLIQSVGYKAKGFRSAEDFLTSRQLLNTACLILDVRMPSMGGFELQRRLITGNQRIPIIFITAYDSDYVRSRAFQAGAAGLLCKPFSQESLFQAVRSALAHQHDIQRES